MTSPNPELEASGLEASGSVRPASTGADSPLELVEVGPRDGLQNEAVCLSPARRARLIEDLAAAGVRRIEAVSFVRPDRVPQMAGAEEVMAAVARRPGVSLIGLVMNARGLRRALDAGVDEVNVVVVASETFSRRNQGIGVVEMVALARELIEEAKAAGRGTSVTISAAFGCPFEGEVPPERVLRIVRDVAPSGPDEIALADTIGVAVPVAVRALVAGAREAAPGVALRCHFHNTRNTGYACALAAVESGVGALDASVGGVGGCPFAPRATGNIATEDLAFMLERSGVPTGVDLPALLAVSDQLAAELGHPPAALLGRAGIFP